MRLVKQKGVGNMKNRVDCPVVTRMTLDFLMVTEHNGLDPGVNEEWLLSWLNVVNVYISSDVMLVSLWPGVSPSRLSVLRVSGQAAKLSGSMRLITFVCWDNYWPLEACQLSITNIVGPLEVKNINWCPLGDQFRNVTIKDSQDPVSGSISSSSRECGSWQSWHRVIEKLSGNDRHKYQFDGASQIDLSAI